MQKTEEFLDQMPEELKSASQSRLVVMYYDEILDALRDAADAVEAGDIVSRCNATIIAGNLVAELYSALDIEQGGEVAENLAQVYGFVLTNLPRVNVDNDATAALESIELLKPLRDSWAELDRRIDAGDIVDCPATPAFIEAALADRSSDQEDLLVA